jgi:hypothetical protein
MRKGKDWSAQNQNNVFEWSDMSTRGLLFQWAKFKMTSEWVLFNDNSAIFLAISCGEQVNFQWDDDEVRFALDQHAELDFYSASSLKQQSAGRHIKTDYS